MTDDRLIKNASDYFGEYFFNIDIQFHTENFEMPRFFDSKIALAK